MSKLAFYVLAPSEKIAAGVFASKVSYESIEAKVLRRVEEYAEHPADDMLTNKRKWFRAWFKPTLERIDLRCISWEHLIEYIELKDPQSGSTLHQFYKKCLEYGGPEKKAL